MRTAVSGLQAAIVATIGLGAVCALAGYLIGHFAAGTSAAHGVGWGLCIGGAFGGFVAGQSGSPGRMLVEGRAGPFGHWWGASRALPESPLAFVFASVAVFAGGIALFVVAG